ncbi:phosphate acyltransferase PlsX [Rhodobacteraceae bacterium NNCM2]|nr:phosphate acyltransferase PlsX [Coraliihabitans acroporae]
MTKRLVLSIDGMGGDVGPAPVIGGIVRAHHDNPELSYLLHGDEAVLRPLVAKHAQLAEVCEIRHAPDNVPMDQQPSQALRGGRGTSMWRAIQSVADGEAGAAVSAGNTGALLSFSVLILRKAPGVDRPAIAVHWPSDHPSGYTTVLDMGADIRADPQNLLQYAVMGAEYSKISLHIDQPRVGLLNIGTEENKGPADVREAATLIRRIAEQDDAGFSYIGFVEGTHIPTGLVDVVVTDGYTGNVALKTGEATARFIRAALKRAFKHTFLSRIGYLFALTSLGRMQKRIDPRRVNGGVFLGLNGNVVKSHGGTDALGFSVAIQLAARMAEHNFPGHLASQLAKLTIDRKSNASAEGAERRVT